MLLLYLSYPYNPESPTMEEMTYIWSISGQNHGENVLSASGLTTETTIMVTEGRGTEYVVYPVRRNRV